MTNGYATAMIQLAEQNGCLDSVNADLHLMKEIIGSHKELKGFLEHPLIEKPDKKDALEKIFRENITSWSMNLVKLLLDNNRMFLLPSIAEQYSKLLSEKRNIDTAQVITAVEIDENTINRVKEKLEKLFNSKINIETHVDKDIIAGMIVKIRDKIIDGSIRTKFENMKKQLIHS